MAGAELVINGHEHDYERFAPQDPDGLADPQRASGRSSSGRVAQSSGRSKTAAPNSEVRDARSHGVIGLELAAGWLRNGSS